MFLEFCNIVQVCLSNEVALYIYTYARFNVIKEQLLSFQNAFKCRHIFFIFNIFGLISPLKIGDLKYCTYCIELG